MNEKGLSHEQILECVKYAFPGNLTGDFEVLDILKGTINDVYRLKVGPDEYALRVRAREKFFAYEKNILKDVVSGRVLTALTGNSIGAQWNERVFDSILADVLKRGRGGPIVSPISPPIIVFDHTCAIIPYLWIIQRWQVGKPLQRGNIEGYFNAGSSVAALHDVKFKSFKTTFNESWMPGSEWTAKYLAEAHDRSISIGIDPEYLSRIILPLSIENFSLVHNDIHPLNIIVGEENSVNFIDWDNMQIAPAEFDLVKMNYWTIIGEDGYFCHGEREYTAFLKGFTSRSGVIIDESIKRLCEIVWLLRVASFEKSRESHDYSAIKPFPNSQYYLNAIRNI